MSLLEKNKLISDESKLPIQVVISLKVLSNHLAFRANEHSNESYGLSNTFEIAIKKFAQHPTNFINENVINSIDSISYNRTWQNFTNLKNKK